MIKRTAVAGAAVAWAVPVVEVLGSRVASAASATTSITSGSAVTYLFGVTNFDGDTITVDYEAGTTQETAVYNVSSSGALSFNVSKSTVATDPFGFAINTTATQISGVVPGADTVESVTITVSAASGTQTQTANGGDPIVIQANG